MSVSDWSYFRQEFGDGKRLYAYDARPHHNTAEQPIPRRYAAVLALESRDIGVMPIPFLLDTGAPLGLYLGTKAVERLRELKVLEDVVRRDCPYLITKAALWYGKQRISPVLECPVPHPHETAAHGTLGNMCCNILGLQVLWHFHDLLTPV